MDYALDSYLHGYPSVRTVIHTTSVLFFCNHLATDSLGASHCNMKSETWRLSPYFATLVSCCRQGQHVLESERREARAEICQPLGEFYKFRKRPLGISFRFFFSNETLLRRVLDGFSGEILPWRGHARKC